MITHSFIYILTFIITALWDIVLRFISENYDTLPIWLQWFKDPKILQPYFKHHTLLSAALLAGFVGAFAQFFILNIHKLPTNSKTFITFMVITFIISGITGLLMQYSKLFPILSETYYKHLGKFKGFYHDGISGLIVQINVLVVLYFIKNFISI